MGNGNKNEILSINNHDSSISDSNNGKFHFIADSTSTLINSTMKQFPNILSDATRPEEDLSLKYLALVSI